MILLEYIMKVLHFYPAPPRNGKYLNPYCAYYRKALETYFKVVDTKSRKRGSLIPFILVLKALFSADIYIFNWIENFSYLRFQPIQYFLIILCFRIIKWRKKKLIWMFHNMHPHMNQGRYSEKIMSFLFNHSNLIIAHSKDATEFAKSRAKHKVIYRCHPFPPFYYNSKTYKKKCNIDILIWGTIFPYKGIIEFLSYLNSVKNKLKVYIIGRCNDEELANSIKGLCSDNISYSNSHVDFQELKNLIFESRYVVFPYIGSCVSSSGALIDTIAMGGNVIGPNKGAFKDLAVEGCCYVYDNYEEILSIIDNNRLLNANDIKTFYDNNSWDNYVRSIIPYLASNN